MTTVYIIPSSVHCGIARLSDLFCTWRKVKCKCKQMKMYSATAAHMKT